MLAPGNPNPLPRPSVFLGSLKSIFKDRILSPCPASTHNGVNRGCRPSCERGTPLRLSNSCSKYGIFSAFAAAKFAPPTVAEFWCCIPVSMNLEAGPDFQRAYIQVGRAAPGQPARAPTGPGRVLVVAPRLRPLAVRLGLPDRNQADPGGGITRAPHRQRRVLVDTLDISLRSISQGSTVAWRWSAAQHRCERHPAVAVCAGGCG